MTKKDPTYKTLDEVADHYEGERLRVIFNPEVDAWYAYAFDEDSNSPIFSAKSLAMVYAGKYGELKPKFAPNGAPSFVGTITRHALNSLHAKRLKVHRYVMSKTYFDDKELVEEFHYARHLLLNGQQMFAADHLNLD